MKSMTAYANSSRRKDSQSIQVILRSSNFKYLDICIYNLPPEKIALEEKIRREIKRNVFRGKVEVHIFWKRTSSSEVNIEEKVLAKYISQAKSLAKKYKMKSNLDIAEFLKLPQVIFWEEAKCGGDSLVLPAVKQALKRLMEFKKKEGRIIKKEMLKNIGKLKKNVKNIQKEKPSARRGDNNKEDIDEEVSLAAFYISQMGKKVNSKDMSPKGKSIDFLTQELLREFNAASSKTKHKKLSALIVESKNYLERIREQAQNIE